MIEPVNNACAFEDCGAVKFDKSDHQLSWQPCPVCKNKKTLKKLIGTGHVFGLLFDDNHLFLWGNFAKVNEDNQKEQQQKEEQQEAMQQEAMQQEETSTAKNSNIFTTEKAFAQIDDKGNVTTWGHKQFGGDSTEVQQELHHITHIKSTDAAFAAITNDKRVVTWGYKDFGGDSQTVQVQLTDVIQISASGFSFAALKDNGEVITWGHLIYTKAHIGADTPDGDKILEELNSGGGTGGDSDEVSDLIQQEVVQVVATHMAFAAHKVNETNGNESIVVWGNHYYGGTFQSGQMCLFKNIASVGYEDERLIIRNVEGGEVSFPT